MVSVFDGKLADNVFSNHVQNGGCNEAISPKKVETAKPVVPDQTDFGSDEFLGPVAIDELDGTSLWHDVQKLVGWYMVIA